VERLKTVTQAPSHQQPEVLQRGNEVVLHALLDESAPARALVAVMVGRISKVALLKMLPPFAVFFCCLTAALFPSPIQ